ncbi:hypothetical protein [uncultured Sphingomonas sp.]|uniref:hypothetical protein n=1 Tax=uncultured Sphingomonas sp. TaxID=158754 RepID=UPI003748CDA7
MLLLWQQQLMNTFKEPLPSGWSYALKPSVLERALAEAGASSKVSLHQRFKIWVADPPAFSATFYPRGWLHFYEVDTFSVTSAAVRSDEKPNAIAFAHGVFVPALVEWIASIERLPVNSTFRRESQELACLGGPKAQPASTILARLSR